MILLLRYFFKLKVSTHPNFLGVNTCYDNHQAVLIWTFQLLEREPALNELAEIKKYFLLIFPDSVYQLA
ncbi:hypothetical protein ABTF34_16265 [Acinetobacter baumannii]